MSKTFLKVKIKSLAAEAVIIRKEENKFKRLSKRQWDPTSQEREDEHMTQVIAAREIWLDLKSHRRFDVREEARSALLAYGYINGRPYKKLEATCYVKPDLKRVAQLVLKFDPNTRKSLGNISAADQNAAMVKKLIEWTEA